MASDGGSRMAGKEVPLLSIDSVEWVQVSISSSPNSLPDVSENPLAKDFASCCIVGDPPSYFIWRTSKSKQNTLELLELSSNKEISRIGLRLIFPDALVPFALIFKNEGKFSSRNPFVLYAVTISGIAYLIRLRNNFDYGDSSLVPSDEILECDTQIHHHGTIQAVTAVAGCIFIGWSDGLVSCYQIGLLDPSAPDFMFELQDDSGFGRLWNILSRGPNLTGVRDLAVSEVYQKRLLFVLHSDGVLRVWDLLTRCKVFGHAMTDPTSIGSLVKLWVGEPNHSTGVIPLAILHDQNLGTSSETLFLYGLHCNGGDRIACWLDPSLKKVVFGKGGTIDICLTSDKLVILRKDGLVQHNLFFDGINEESTQYYYLLEEFVADLLFQNSGRSSEDLLWLAYAVFSTSKEEVTAFVSSIFTRGILLPGVHYNEALKKTFGKFDKHFTDFEFSSFTTNGLKKEISSLIECRGGYENPVSNLRFWNVFCSQHVDNWCKYNAACGLLIDSATGALGLLRKNTISLFRGLEDAEHIISGSLDEHKTYFIPGLDNPGDEVGGKIQIEFLRCVCNVKEQLGKVSSAIFYESLLNTTNVSLEDVVTRLVKIIHTGYNSSIPAIQMSELGANTSWEKTLSNHRSLRKFSTEIFLALRTLYKRTASWIKVLDVVESYLKLLVPHKVKVDIDSKSVLSLNCHAIVQSTSQIAKVMFESAFDVLLLLRYIIHISGQINMSLDDVSRIKLELLPVVQEIVTEWHIIHYFGTTSSETPAIEDFSSRLSSLQIDSNADKRLWSRKLGTCDFSLSIILFFNMQTSSEGSQCLSFRRLLNSSNLTNCSREFVSWLIWGKTGEESSLFFSNSIDLALILLRHCQYNASEYLLTLVVDCLRKEKTFESIQAINGKLASLFHLLGCSHVAQAQHGLHRAIKDKNAGEALRCFFRAASVKGASRSLQCLSSEAGWLRCDFGSHPSDAAWKLQYYQWVMQLFEQFNMSEAASLFALAALEQVDEVLDPIDSSSMENNVESAFAIKGRLWANVFKLTLDLNNYSDAYCAIISNPDEESKNICLRRFIIVLYERNETKILCDGKLPLIGLLEKVERELAWKAERSDLSNKPNPFHLLYAFEMHRHNWRGAATCMYLYSLRLKDEAVGKDHQRPLILEERLNGLSAAINALQLVHPAYAWIELPMEETYLDKEAYPNKKARMIPHEQSHMDDAPPQKPQFYLDVEKLENEFVLTSAEHLLSLSNVKWTSIGFEKPSSKIIDLLVESNSYDMAFTVILKFWKGSAMKRELERVFTTLAYKCCPSKSGHSLHEQVKDRRTHGLLLASAQQESDYDSFEANAAAQSYMKTNHWIALELYLGKYKSFHPRLPLIVGETLLSADPQIELPLWLVQIFKGIRNESNFGMTGSESNPGSLFSLYVDYGRFTEAVNLLAEYMQALLAVRPADVIRRKRPFAVWFPYTSIERLWWLLEESIRLGHRVEKCEKLKKVLHGVLSSHLYQLKVDSDDIRSFAT